MTRFAVLRHDHPQLHWDFLIESEGALLAWRLPEPPAVAGTWEAVPLPPHRLAYLDYEGPVSGNRGTVSRWDGGSCEVGTWDGERLTAICTGQHLRGRVNVARCGNGWRLTVANDHDTSCASNEFLRKAQSMLTHAVTLFQVHLKPYCQRLYADIPADLAHTQPSPGMNTPSWLLGHLALAADYAARLAGREGVCPASYGELFAPGTQPDVRTGDHPPLDELMRMYASAHDAAAAAVPHISAAAMATPNPFGHILPHLAATGDVLSHLLTTHEGIHLGQLSTWRRAAGLGSV